MRVVLVDTSVWVRFLRGEQSNEVKALEVLVETGAASVCGLVLCELFPLGGSARIREESERFFRGLPRLPEPPELWETVLALKTRCIKAGVTGMGLPDLVIAAVAIHSDAALLTLDKHFVSIRRAAPELDLAT